jgi:hypothetical protein
MVVMNEVKIKYEYLDKIMAEKLIDIRFTNTVHVIVDVKEVFRKYFRHEVDPIRVSERLTIEEISSDIIGIVSHYRNYFYKKGKYSSFYLLYSESESEYLKSEFPDYKKHHYDKYFNNPEYSQKINIIKKVVKVVEKVVNHLPNCMYVNTSNFDELVSAKFLINKINKNELIFVLSNDEMMFQLVDKNVLLINMKGIKSQLAGIENAVSVVCERESKISSRLLPLILSIAGLERYGLFHIEKMGMLKSLNLVEKLVERNKIIDTEYLNFPIQISDLSNKDRAENLLIENYNDFVKNYRLVKLDHVLHSNNIELSTSFNKPAQIYKMDYFLELNSKIFTNFPLALDMLVKGEKI